MKDFLIIGGYNYANRRLLHEFRQLGHESRILAPENLLPYIHDKKGDRMYLLTDTDEPKRLFKNSLACIIPRIGYDLQFFSKAVLHISRNIGIPTTATADGLLNAQDKIKTVQLLSQNGIKTPKTFAIKKAKNVEFIVKTLGGFPVVAKLIYGSRGVGVFILESELAASTTLDAFTSQGHSLLLQQFIETAKADEQKHDFRAVVVDGEVLAAFKRKSVGKDFRTNASLHDEGEAAELDEEMTQTALKSAAAVGLSVAGVDLARDVNTGEVYVYEVNGNMNYKSTEKFSGKNVAKKIAEYAVKISGVPVKMDSEDLSAAFGFGHDTFNVLHLQKGVGIPFGEFSNENDGDHEDLECSTPRANFSVENEKLKKQMGFASFFSINPLKNHL